MQLRLSRQRKGTIQHQTRGKHLEAFRKDKQWQLNRMILTNSLLKNSRWPHNFNQLTHLVDISLKTHWLLKNHLVMLLIQHLVTILNKTSRIITRAISKDIKHIIKSSSNIRRSTLQAILRSDHKQPQLKGKVNYKDHLRGGKKHLQ
jgi:hypothetical protein